MHTHVHAHKHTLYRTIAIYAHIYARDIIYAYMHAYTRTHKHTRYIHSAKYAHSHIYTRAVHVYARTRAQTQIHALYIYNILLEKYICVHI